MNIWLVLLILSLVLLIFFIFKKFNHIWLKVLAIILTLILFGFSLFRFIFPLNSSPDPVGGMAIQSATSFYEYDSPSPDMETSPGKREIPVHIWAPQELRPGEHPVFVFSHGSFGVGISNETLFKELASRGYIVLSLDHPHHSFTTRLSDESRVTVDTDFMQSVMSAQGSDDLQTTWDNFNDWLAIRLDDVAYLIEEITDDHPTSDFESAMDLDRIVLSGHSLGGSAMLGIGREYADKVQALVILEAPFITDIQGVQGDDYVFNSENPPLPILHIYSDALYGKTDDITTYQMNDRLIHSNDPKYVNHHIEGVGHIGLTDMALATPMITNMVDGGLNTREASDTLLEINEVVVDFLKTYNQ